MQNQLMVIKPEFLKFPIKNHTENVICDPKEPFYQLDICRCLRNSLAGHSFPPDNADSYLPVCNRNFREKSTVIFQKKKNPGRTFTDLNGMCDILLAKVIYDSSHFSCYSLGERTSCSEFMID